jgi:two-component system, response regulator
MPTPTPQQRILLIEDSPEDVVTAKRNLLQSGLRNPVEVCETGQLALDYIFQRGTFSQPDNAPVPGVILLDLDLPDMSGLEILSIIKQDITHRSIPVIIMTSSMDERDFEESRQAGAATYLSKPVDFQKFFHAIQQLQGFAFELMVFPSSEGAP